MAISFTRSLIAQLEKEIAELHALVREQKKKREKAESKIKGLKHVQKRSQSANDLSNKITRENKLKKEIEQIDLLLVQSSKQLAEKKELLEKQRAKGKGLGE
jgi:septal ring factor EnvC (AmiA/AmiB activator)